MICSPRLKGLIISRPSKRGPPSKPFLFVPRRKNKIGGIMLKKRSPGHLNAKTNLKVTRIWLDA